MSLRIDLSARAIVATRVVIMLLLIAGKALEVAVVVLLIYTLLDDIRSDAGVVVRRKTLPSGGQASGPAGV